MKPIVSIIIPCYNVEKYINKCIDSVLNSTLKDIEIIAIDDGSKDATYKILKEYTDERLKVFTQENMGQAKTRNKAINLSSGEYLFFLDSDDYIDTDLLSKLYSETKNGSDIVISDAKGIDDITNLELMTIKYNKYSDNDIKNYILNSSGPAWKLIKKDIITKNNLYFYEDHIYEDIAVVPSWGLYANKISYVPNTYYYYIIRNGSTMNQVEYSKKLEDIFYSLDHLKDLFKDKYCDELEYIFIEHLLHAASLRFYKFNKYDMIDKIVSTINKYYPNWDKNIYYKKQGIKYRIICKLFYKKQYKLLKLLLKK